ncbi:uncharacterized protein DUF4846 [Tissierella praeacuta]|uniref:DUF4846 domain-containing protein n=1 Tax=Tissierella praeacuta TaxID=43131 RepID=UPI0010E2E04B|nr:DUF4846 domain-containing protein [Tissierella praeacuta]TCU74165.1 uncharacterized protein DUF4846 [Tissierella praeacuta]
MNKRLIAIFIITGSLISIIYWRFFNINSLPKKDIILETEFPAKFESNKQINYLNKNGNTIQERYLTLEGYKRIEVEKNSFQEFLRNQRLKPYGEKVLYYNGREKNKKGVYDSVIDVKIGDRDLHQCADAIMLLRAEYLYSVGKYEDISFNFVSGFKAEYKKWMEGYRIKVDGNDVRYYKAVEPSNTYENFRKFMDMVFAYSGTLSLEKELESIDIKDMEIGDVFIVGGSPGHAVIIVDMAINNNDEKIFILAQSYMPAQQTQILINPMNEEISPWYSTKDKEKLITPEWTFELNKLKRFVE